VTRGLFAPCVDLLGGVATRGRTWRGDRGETDEAFGGAEWAEGV